MSNGNKKLSSTAVKGIGFGIFAIIAAIFVSSIYKIVPIGEEAAVSQAGKVDMTRIITGSGFKMPWVTYDNYNLQSRQYQLRAFGIAAQDKFKNKMDINYTGRFLTGYANKIRATTGTSDMFLVTHVHKTVASCAVRAGVTVATSQDFYNETIQRNMADYTVDCANDYFNSAAVGGGYEITKVQFSDVVLDSRVEAFMLQTKKRIEDEEQQNSSARIAASRAQEIVAQNKAKADAAVFKALERNTLADAKLYEAKQEAAGNLEIAKSMTKDLVQYTLAQKWDGKQPGVLVGSGSGIELQLQK